MFEREAREFLINHIPQRQRVSLYHSLTSFVSLSNILEHYEILEHHARSQVLRENQRDMDILARVLVVMEKSQHSVDAARVMMKLLEGGTDTLVRVHTSKIIHVLVKSARTGREEEQREIAIRCLEIMSELVPYHVLHPHKIEVIRGLKLVLDDRKRSVRRRAVRCVNRWEVLK